MQNETKLVCLGIDWSSTGQPTLRMGNRRSTASSFLLPLKHELRFRVIEPRIRFCMGWFKLNGLAFNHVNCQTWEVVNNTRQCQRCLRLEGFVAAHQAHHNPERLRKDIKRYLMQPHYLYMAMFADGSVKVGTVAESRIEVRLAEQGAVAAFYIARTADGLAVRRVEEIVSSSLGISQSLSSKRKLRALTNKVKAERLTSRLTETVREARTVIDRLNWIKSLDELRKWVPPSSALRAFSLAPAKEYVASLTEGEHSLHIRGITGTIAVFGTRSASDSPLFVADLSELKGRELQFGDYRSPDQFVQETLF